MSLYAEMTVSLYVEMTGRLVELLFRLCREKACEVEAGFQIFEVAAAGAFEGGVEAADFSPLFGLAGGECCGGGLDGWHLRWLRSLQVHDPGMAVSEMALALVLKFLARVWRVCWERLPWLLVGVFRPKLGLRLDFCVGDRLA